MSNVTIVHPHRRYPLKSVWLNGQRLDRAQFQFYQHYGAIGSGPHKVGLGRGEFAGALQLLVAGCSSVSMGLPLPQSRAQSSLESLAWAACTVGTLS